MGNGMNKTLRPWRDAGRQAKLLSMKQKALGKEAYEVVSHYKLPVGESDFIVAYHFRERVFGCELYFHSG